jgi:hypothetical protein
MSLADCVMIGALVWIVVSAVVVWWIDREIKRAPPMNGGTPNDEGP